MMQSYQLFKDQKNRFVDALLQADKNVTPKVNWGELSEKNIRTHTNWFIGFVPDKWGVFKQGWFGVHFEFYCCRDRKTKAEYVRLPVGVEKPFKRAELGDEFKGDVVKTLKQRNIILPECVVWPDCSPKLLEPSRVVLDDNSWEKMLNTYLRLGDFVDVVAEVIRKYYDRGCFTVDLDFPV